MVGSAGEACAGGVEVWQVAACCRVVLRATMFAMAHVS